MRTLVRLVGMASMLAIAVSLGPSQASAQRITQQAVSTSTALTEYNTTKRDPMIAVLGEVFIPIAGHAYAGNPQRGVKPLLLSVGGLALMLAGGAKVSCVESGNALQRRSNCTSKSSTLFPLGAMTYVAGRVWGAMSAKSTANEHNVELRKRLKLPPA